MYSKFRSNGKHSNTVLPKYNNYTREVLQLIAFLSRNIGTRKQAKYSLKGTSKTEWIGSGAKHRLLHGKYFR